MYLILIAQTALGGTRHAPDGFVPASTIPVPEAVPWVLGVSGTFSGGDANHALVAESGSQIIYASEDAALGVALTVGFAARRRVGFGLTLGVSSEACPGCAEWPVVPTLGVTAIVPIAGRLNLLLGAGVLLDRYKGEPEDPDAFGIDVSNFMRPWPMASAGIGIDVGRR